MLVMVLTLSACDQFKAALSPEPTRSIGSPRVRQIVDAAKAQRDQTRNYDPAYVRIGYPNGDVRPERGVCADVVVRAFRQVGLDLQKEVHEDMQKNFSKYPNLWGLSKPDSNIDHRRVPNLMTYFARKGKTVAVTDRASDYLSGDVVAWRFDNGLYHIGMVSDILDQSSRAPKMVHNVGAGVQIEDVLFKWKIIGHYRLIN
jgi:uncharacterized protein YijF (DUF1287 family)